MPRNGLGVYGKPNPSVVTQTEISSSEYNSTIDDFVAEANSARPLTAGGTGATSAADARTNLDVAQKQASVTDTTSGAGMVVGAFGLGGEAPEQANWNTGSLYSGWLKSNATNNTGIPTTANIYSGIRSLRTTTAGWDIVGGTDGSLWFRALLAGTWGTYRRVFHQGNILGTVSQTSSVPTGAIIEKGFDATNGSFTRWADGTMIAFNQVQQSIAIDTSYFGGFRSANISWTFPSTFAFIPQVVVTVQNSTAFGAILGAATVSAADARVTSISSETASNRIVNFTAMGRWF